MSQTSSTFRDAEGTETPPPGCDSCLRGEIAKSQPSQHIALVLPGGVKKPDLLRLDKRAVRLVKAFVDAGRPVAAICHGSWLLNDRGLITSRQSSDIPAFAETLIQQLQCERPGMRSQG